MTRKEGGRGVNRLVKLERMLERGLDRLRHPETGRELVEAIPELLDEIEDHLEPSGGRGRAFPYDRVAVTFRVAAEDRDAARALVKDLPVRIRERLRAKAGEPPDDLEIQVRCVVASSAPADERPFRVRYRRRREGAAPRRVAPAREAPSRLHLVVVRGRTAAKEHSLGLGRINLGRLEKVATSTGSGARKNHVWFAASEDTVSRAHARIERVGAEWLLFDEGSTSGTRVLRASDEIELMPRASRGVPLQDGDRIELGRGCIVEVRVVKGE